MLLTRILAACLVIAPAVAIAQDAPSCGLYTYKANIVRVIDGDTVVADIDLGFDVWLRKEHLRLVGIDAPENKTDAGKAVTATLKGRIEGQSLYICTMKAKRSDSEAVGSFGRYLATVYHEGESINAWLVAQGYATALAE